MMDVNLTVLTIVPGRLNAEAVLSYLNAFDVQAIISMEAIGSVYPVTVGELGSVEILVKQQDFEKASQLLADFYQEHEAGDFYFDDEEEQDTGDDRIMDLDDD